MPVSWWILYGLAAAVPLGLLAASLVLVREDLEHSVWIGVDQLGLCGLALLAGGPARAVDALLIDMIEKEQVTVHDGVLTHTPVSGEPVRLSLTPEFVIRNAIAAAGSARLAELRESACSINFVFELRFRELVQDGLAIGYLRRRFVPAGWAVGTFVPVFAVAMGMTARDQGTRWAVSDLVAWLLSFALMALALGVVLHRPGYGGSDPGSATGRAVLRRLRSEVDSTTSQAVRVALGGFAAMSQPEMRADVQGGAPDRGWRCTRHAGGAPELLVRRLLTGPPQTYV
jgi:uncharacterized protein (TIGR04222 family)